MLKYCANQIFIFMKTPRITSALSALLLAPVLVAQEPQSPIIHTPDGPAQFFTETRVFVNGKELNPQEVEQLTKGVEHIAKAFFAAHTPPTTAPKPALPVEQEGDKVFINGHELPPEIAAQMIESGLVAELQTPGKKTQSIAPMEKPQVDSVPACKLRPARVAHPHPAQVKKERCHRPHNPQTRPAHVHTTPPPAPKCGPTQVAPAPGVKVPHAKPIQLYKIELPADGTRTPGQPIEVKCISSGELQVEIPAEVLAKIHAAKAKPTACPVPPCPVAPPAPDCQPAEPNTPVLPTPALPASEPQPTEKPACGPTNVSMKVYINGEEVEVPTGNSVHISKDQDGKITITPAE